MVRLQDFVAGISAFASGISPLLFCWALLFSMGFWLFYSLFQFFIAGGSTLSLTHKSVSWRESWVFLSSFVSTISLGLHHNFLSFFQTYLKSLFYLSLYLKIFIYADFRMTSSSAQPLILLPMLVCWICLCISKQFPIHENIKRNFLLSSARLWPRPDLLVQLFTCVLPHPLCHHDLFEPFSHATDRYVSFTLFRKNPISQLVLEAITSLNSHRAWRAGPCHIIYSNVLHDF